MSLLPKLISGTHMGEKEILHKHVTSVVIESDEPVDSHLDGELQPQQQRFEIELLPRALRLL